MAEPRLLVLCGEDAYSRDEEVRRLKAEQRAQAAGEHNLEELRGEALDLARLQASCAALPFLAERRLVIAEGLLGRLVGVAAADGARGGRKRERAAPKDGEREALARLFENLPPTTLLVLVEDRGDVVKRAEPLLPRGLARVIDFPRPNGAELDRWIARRATAKGLTLREDGLRLLAQHGGEDLGLLDGELAKLAAYADGAPVGAQEVRLLGIGHEESVFTLLDALLEGRSSIALATLRGLYDHGRRPEELLPQVIAFVRRLLIAREVATRRLPVEEVAREHDVSAYAISRVLPRARVLGTRQLDAALGRLLEADRAMKTSARDPEAELELAVGRVAALLRRRA